MLLRGFEIVNPTAPAELPIAVEEEPSLLQIPPGWASDLKLRAPAIQEAAAPGEDEGPETRGLMPPRGFEGVIPATPAKLPVPVMEPIWLLPAPAGWAPPKLPAPAVQAEEFASKLCLSPPHWPPAADEPPPNPTQLEAAFAEEAEALLGAELLAPAAAAPRSGAAGVLCGHPWRAAKIQIAAAKNAARKHPLRSLPIPASLEETNPIGVVPCIRSRPSSDTHSG